jgi:hypothetical protein
MCFAAYADVMNLVDHLLLFQHFLRSMDGITSDAVWLIIQ